jgi:hypothetical protein
MPGQAAAEMHQKWYKEKPAAVTAPFQCSMYSKAVRADQSPKIVAVACQLPKLQQPMHRMHSLVRTNHQWDDKFTILQQDTPDRPMLTERTSNSAPAPPSVLNSDQDSANASNVSAVPANLSVSPAAWRWQTRHMLQTAARCGKQNKLL